MALDIMAELMRDGDTDTGWPKAWHPETEPVLVGTVLRFTVAPGQHGPCKTAIIQRDDDTRVAVWQNSVVLESLFATEDPKPGEKIGLRYLGKHPEKNYKKFRLIVDRAEAPSPAPHVARLTTPDVQVDSCATDPFGDDEAHFGTNPLPESYQAVALTRPPARTNGRPLSIRGTR